MIYLAMYPIGRSIYSVRIKKGITQAELARLTHIPQGNISNIEKGKRDVTVSTFLKICSSLEVEPASFFESKSLKKFSFTREMLERIAHAAVHPDFHLIRHEKEVARLARKQIPEFNQQKMSEREISETWFELKELLSNEQLNVLFERIYDEQKRSR